MNSTVEPTTRCRFGEGQYQLDAFPEENRNPFSDHNYYVSVNSEQTMAQIMKCVDSGRHCE